mmetsp:Transcript_21040/g.53963  ORF Transcript_21040/g.53963 Transcript_21040/m.53963 type:complete len:125 (-) Transcript_21040:165-539(-)|eukprot:jgi/Tetstr1/435507/TSEL_024411.t1
MASRATQLGCLLVVAALCLGAAGVGASRALPATTTGEIAAAGRGLLVVPRGGVELKKFQMQQQEEGEGDLEEGEGEEGGYEEGMEDGDVDGGDFDQNEEMAEEDDAGEEDVDQFEEDEEDNERF